MDEKLELANEAGIFPVRPEDMPSEDLARLVVNRFNKFREFLPYIAELRKRFAELPRGHANIMGCKTWTQFCNDVLGRTGSAVRKALAEKNASPRTMKFLLEAIKRMLPICHYKDKHKEYAHVRFSVSESGNLLLSVLSAECRGESCEEEIPEAIVLKPGGPGLFAGDFGCVNLSSDPFDFTIEALYLLPALDHGDPTIIYRGNTNVEFRFKENFVVYIQPLQFHGSPTAPRLIYTEEDRQAQAAFDARQRAPAPQSKKSNESAPP